MKSNRIPAATRLRNHIAKLEARQEGSRGRKRGNPYLFCKGCGKHDPEIHREGGSHGKRCPYAGLDREIAHYRALLLWATSDPHVL